MAEEKVANAVPASQLKMEKQWKVCSAGYNCWIRNGQEYCAICGKGNEGAWRLRCDGLRKMNGMPSYADVLAKLQKEFPAKP